MDDYLESIKKENIAGASVVSGRVLKVFENYAKTFDTDKSIGNFRDVLLKTGKEIIAAQPFMASNYRKINEIVQKLRESEKKCKKSKDCVNELLNIIKNIKDSDKKSKEHCIECGDKIIKNGSTILTFSYSSMVESVIKAAHKNKKDLHIIIGESRPMKEGKELARNISKIGIKITYTTDVVLPSLIEQCDMVFLGADWVAEDFFINKIGTKVLVNLAFEQKIPVYIFCISEKILSRKYYPKTIDDNDPKEIDKELNEIKNIRIFNPYFEKIDLHKVQGIITENGLLNIDEIQSICDSIVMDSDLI